MARTHDQILEPLQSQKPEDMLGWFEGEELECKREPYRLTHDDQKLELAKDVSGLANAGGGVLLIGMATVKDPAHGDDRISEVVPFPRNLFDAQQYHDTISAWTWPSLDNVVIRPYPVPGRPDHLLAAIVVAPIPAEHWPVLVTRSLNATGRRVETLFGLFERKRSHTGHVDARQLQTFVRDGRRVDALLHEELAAIRAELAEGRERAPPASAIDAQTVLGRVSISWEEMGAGSEPRFILMGIPAKALDLRGLFESRRSRLSQLVEYPPELYDHGFGIDAGRNSALVRGQARRTVTRGDRMLEIYRDGMALSLHCGDGRGLCYAMERWNQGPLTINPVMLIETVYLFMKFLFEAYREDIPAGQSFDVVAQLQCKENEAARFKLQEGYIRGRGAYHEVHQWRGEFRTSVRMGEDDSERAAVMLLGEIYGWFGIEGDKIPYTTVNANDTRQIDPQALANP